MTLTRDDFGRMRFKLGDTLTEIAYELCDQQSRIRYRVFNVSDPEATLFFADSVGDIRGALLAVHWALTGLVPATQSE